MSSQALIRNARPDDFEEIIVHIDAAFGFPPGRFADYFPHHWRPDLIDWSQIWVAEDEGRIAALVRIFPLQVVQDGARLSVGGIGTVSTADWARGRGHMTTLLERTNQAMREAGHDLAVLWGDRHRYGEFGYETAGRVYVVSIGRRGLNRLGIAARHPKAFHGEAALLKRIAALYDALPYRRLREDWEVPLIYRSTAIQVHVSHGENEADDEEFAYLVQHEHRIIEWGGNVETALQMANWICGEKHHDLYFRFPEVDLIPEIFQEAKGGWSIEPYAQIQVLNPSAVIAAYATDENLDSGVTAAFDALPPRQLTTALFTGLEEGFFNFKFFLPGTDNV